MKTATAKIITYILVLSVIFTIFTVNVSATVYKKDISEGTYVFYSKLGNNMVLDVDNASKKSGANIQLWEYNKTNAQIFEVKKSGSYYTIKPLCSGMALDVSNASPDSGTNVQQYTPNGTDAQKWMFYDAGNGYYCIRCAVGNCALDASGGKNTNGTNIQMYSPNGSAAQQWKLVKVNANKSSSASAQKPSKNTKSKSLAQIALGEVGTKGTKKNGTGSGDYQKYGKWFGSNGVQWCAQFVSWCVAQAGVSTKTVPKTASCNIMKNNSNAYHKWNANALKNIKKNDVIFFSSSTAQNSHHVGIVYSVSGSKITVIEGNSSSDTVKKNTYTVNANTGKISGGRGSWAYFCGYIAVN